MSGATDLLNLLKPGISVYIPGSSGEPTAALQLLAQAPDRCAGVHFITSFVPGINTFDLSSLGPGASFSAFFMHPSLRRAEAEGRVRFLDLPYSGIADWLNEYPVDLALAQVSAETRGNLVSLGPAVEFTPIVLRRSVTRVAVQNRQTPWLPGSAQYPLADFDLVLDGDTALPTYSDPELNDTYMRIGTQVAVLIPDGATVQTGLGQAPAAVLNALIRHHGLKCHSGVFSDSMLRLIDSGAIDAESGCVTGVAVGSTEFYRRLGEFPAIRYVAVSDTHAAEKLAAIPRFFSINSAIEVDLQGNLNAEYLNGKRISGRGGLPDFAAGGHRSAGGGSIIVMPSTDGSGGHSRIVRALESDPTVGGELVDYVVTEHGCARLRGLSRPEREIALLAISSPALRQTI